MNNTPLPELSPIPPNGEQSVQADIDKGGDGVYGIIQFYEPRRQFKFHLRTLYTDRNTGQLAYGKGIAVNVEDALALLEAGIQAINLAYGTSLSITNGE